MTMYKLKCVVDTVESMNLDGICWSREVVLPRGTWVHVFADPPGDMVVVEHARDQWVSRFWVMRRDLEPEEDPEVLGFIAGMEFRIREIAYDAVYEALKNRKKITWDDEEVVATWTKLGLMKIDRVLKGEE